MELLLCRGNQIIDELEELIRDGVEDGDVAEGWLEDWDDVEYRISKNGNYRGVVLFQADYDGLSVEIDTARMMISVLTEDGKTVEFRYVEDEETLRALTAIDREWEAEYEEWEEAI